MLNIPVVTLSNGLRVANFSSPHEFHFVDGSVLSACSPEWAREMMLDAEEREALVETQSGVAYTDIGLCWKLSDVVRWEIDRLRVSDDFDVLIIPLPVMTALKEARLPIGRMRCIRMADRVTKKAHIDRFCV